MTDQPKEATTPSQQPPAQGLPYYPYPPYPAFSPEEDEINLLDYWRVIWKGKWIIALLFTASVIAMGWYSFNLPKIFQSGTTVIPTDSGGGGLASALSAIPFAGALGGALPSTPTDKIMAILESRVITERVISRLNLMPVLFEEAWDPARKTWREGLDPQPTVQKAITVLQKGVVKVSTDKRGIISVVVEFKDPIQAALIANTYIQILAEYLNNHSINANFQVLDVAVPAEHKFKPSIRLNLMLAGVVSLFFGIFLVFFIEYIRRVRENEKNRGNADLETSKV